MKAPFTYLLHYCKSLKKTGNPIVLRTINLDTSPSLTAKKALSSEEDNIHSFKYTGMCEIEVVFNNADGKAKRAGATTIMELTPLQEDGIKNIVFVDGVRTAL
jgi:hypothetical protein